VEDHTLDGTMMDNIPLDYLLLHKNKIGIKDRATKKIVLVLSFTKFEDIESSQEYQDFEKLSMSLVKLRKGRSGFIKNNKAQVSGKMFALGWRRVWILDTPWVTMLWGVVFKVLRAI